MRKLAILIPTIGNFDYRTVSDLINLDMPSDYEVSWMISKHSPVDRNRNLLADTAIEAGADIILWLDSDMTFPRHTVTTLLNDIKEGKDIVGGLYFRKNSPFMPHIYKDGKQPKHIIDYAGTIEVDVLGGGCMMMSTETLKKVRYPYFKKENVWDSRSSGVGDDFSFCRKARKRGLKLWCNTSVKCGHLSTIEITEGYFDITRRQFEKQVENK